MHGSTQPEDAFPSVNAADTTTGTGPTSSVSASADPAGAVGGRSNGSRGLEEAELDSALQLLVERAQYITGATGTALALPQGEEMVCRASAGASAPAVGARLQVRSGLTGESIARRQLLRCDNAESDPRVNLETCRALGIASIVVLPLLRRSGEVRGLFELFSDHPYAFEERDLIALERMADLTLTALDLAEQRQNIVPAPAPRREPERPAESPAATATATATIAPPASSIPLGISVQTPLQDPVSVPLKPELVEPGLVKPELAEPPAVPAEPPEIPSPLPVSSLPVPVPASVPEAMLRVEKCASCGFPVSEGRTLCLDCEQKDAGKKAREKEQGEIAHGEPEQDPASASAAAMEEEFVPAFLRNAVPARESWLANHVNLLAIVVLILGILVFVVVFR
jgi:putative methionine-R-sulfoxide reductase with GAF domain